MANYLFGNQTHSVEFQDSYSSKYYPRQDSMSLLLPLALVSEDRVHLALVVERTKLRSYLGHTIFPLGLGVFKRQTCLPPR